MVWRSSPLAPIGKIKSGKKNTVKRYTSNSATPIGANTMFLQIGKRQFFPTLPIICSHVAAKCFMRNTRWCPFKFFFFYLLKNNVQRPNTEALPTG
jgi:hypothetical protein